MKEFILDGNKFNDMEGFYNELGEVMDSVRDQLLERFEVQCNKRCYNFPFLLGQGVWTNGEKLKLISDTKDGFSFNNRCNVYIDFNNPKIYYIDDETC